MAIQVNPDSRGLAVIFTNDYKHTKSPLEGPFEDGKRLETAFKEINFDVHWKNNVTSPELRDIMRGLSKLTFETVEHYKCMLFVFSGHGQGGKIVMQDSQEIDICVDFIDPILPERAPAIGDVPKIFIIDACRGGDETATVQVPTSLVTKEAEAEAAPNNPRADTRAFIGQLRHLPQKGNFLVAYSTLPGCVSFEYTGIGSLWLKIIASKIPVANESIEDLLTVVNQEMMEIANKESFEFQQPEKLARLNKLLFLKDLGVTLISKNLSAVLEATWEARAEYYQLGLCMGLSGNDMDAINANNRGQVGACWTQTLKKCINRGLTQDELVKALCSTTVGMNEVAIRIRQMTF